MTKPILAKDPNNPLQVIVLGRISTPHQNIENIEASYEDSQRRLTAMYSGPVYFKQLGEQGSGWKLQRASILEAEDDIRTGRWDLVIMEDIGRAYRNPAYQYRLAHICKDYKTRLICFGDGLDTAEDNWEAILGTAVLRHSMQVPETRRRVRRTADHTFHNGGMVICLCYGYRKLTKEEAASGQFGPKGLRVMKLPECTPIILEICARILRGDSYTSIAEWLNDEKVPTGPRSKKKRWTAAMVVGLMRNPLLLGIRRFRVTKYELKYETGVQAREVNPTPEIETVPELAHLTMQQQVEVLAAMDAYAPPRPGRKNSRRGKARKESIWPGQHLKCEICGAVCYWCPKGRLRCCNARPAVATCWNQTLVDAEQIRQKVLPAILAAVRLRPELLRMLVDAIFQEFERRTTRDSRRQDDLEHQVRDLERRRNRIMELLIEAESSEGLLQQLQSTELALRGARQSFDQLRATQQEKQQYLCREDVDSHLEEIVLQLSRTSYAFGQLMRRTFEPMTLVPVRALDTHQMHPRIRVTLPPLPGEAAPVTLVIDAFDPPQQIRYAKQMQQMQLEHPGRTVSWISQQIGLERKTAYDAARYARLMAGAGTDEPFLEQRTKPEKASRWRKQSLAMSPQPDASPSCPENVGNQNADDSEASAA